MNDTTKSTRPDESEKAREQINQSIALSTDHINHATARLIAATLHAGEGTALERFAGTGRFDVVSLEREVRMERYAFPQELWRGALLGYIAWQRTRQPWTRGLSAGQLRRLSNTDATVPTTSEPPFSAGERSSVRKTQRALRKRL